MTSLTSRTPSARRGQRRVLPLGGLVLVLLVQAVVLYAPQQPGSPPFPNADKVVHALVFLVPTVLALAARLPGRPVVGMLVAHAVVSEVVQAVFLPGRAGDPFDVLADLTGVAVAVVAMRRAARARPFDTRRATDQDAR